MKTVLVVDDSPAVRRQVAAALNGFVVVEAGDGIAGAEVLEARDDIALVICDLNMPRMTGLEMLERLSASLAHRFPKVLMLSTEGRPTVMLKARALGAQGWVVKPFDHDQLRAAACRLTDG